MLEPQVAASSEIMEDSQAIENPNSIDLIEPHLYLGLF